MKQILDVLDRRKTNLKLTNAIIADRTDIPKSIIIGFFAGRFNNILFKDVVKISKCLGLTIRLEKKDENNN